MDSLKILVQQIFFPDLLECFYAGLPAGADLGFGFAGADLFHQFTVARQPVEGRFLPGAAGRFAEEIFFIRKEPVRLQQPVDLYPVIDLLEYFFVAATEVPAIANCVFPFGFPGAIAACWRKAVQVFRQ